MNELQTQIRLLRRRIRLILIERHALAFGAVGAVAAVLAVVLAQKFTELDELWIPGALVAAGLIAGAVFGALRKLTPFAVARAAERRLDLQERLSSVIRLSEAEQRDEMFEALIADSSKQLESVDPRRVFPHTFSRGGKAFAFLAVLLIGLIYLPQIPAFQTKEHRQEVRVMKEQGKRLVKLAKDLQKNSSKNNRDIAKRIAKNMTALGKKMASGRMPRKQAMLATKKLTKQIQEAQRKLAERNASKSGKSPEEAGREFQKTGVGADSEMSKQLQAMQAKLDELSQMAKAGKLTPEQMKEFEKLSQRLSEMKATEQMMSPEMLKEFADQLASGDYEQAVKSLEEIIQKLRAGKYSKAEMKKLAAELKALAKALKGTPFEKICPDLQKAAAALEKGDAKMAADALAEAQRKGTEIAKELKDMQELAKAGGG